MTRIRHSDYLERRGKSALLAVLMLGIVYVFIVLRNAWLGDDAYISFRVIDNFINGYGLRWNVAERVQAFTHPLWLFVLLIFQAATGEHYITSLMVSIAVSAGAIALFSSRVARTPIAAGLGVLIFSLSRSFIDYSTSGLENCLTHLLLAWFLSIFLWTRPTPRKLLTLSFIASLLLLNRMDMLLVFGPMLLWWLVQTVKHQRRVDPSRSALIRALMFVAVGFLPFIAWEMFSLLYYGLLFPNTAYAKLNTGIEWWRLAEQGFHYYLNAITRDPLTLLFIIVGIATALMSRAARHIAAAIGMILYLIYIVRIGGDFMAGRFFTVPLFMAVCLIASSRYLSLPALVISAFVAIALGGSAYAPTYRLTDPQQTQLTETVDNNAIVDERLFYHNTTSLLKKHRDYWMPMSIYVDIGLDMRRSGTRVTSATAVGVIGYYAGPSVYIVDPYALTDPFLSRLPAVKDKRWRIGHFRREMPEGYFDTLTSGVNVIHSKSLARLYHKIATVTRAPVFSSERLREVLNLNLEGTESFIRYYPPRDTIALPYVSEAVLREANSSGTLVIGRGGLDVKMPKTKASAIRVGLDGDDTYHLRFSLNGQDQGTLKVPERVSSQGMVHWTFEVPLRAEKDGYDTITVLPYYGSEPYQLGYLELMQKFAVPGAAKQ